MSPTELTQMKCVPCSGDTPTLTVREIAELKPKVPKWSVVKRSGTKRLERVFKFKDFAEALAFTDNVWEIAKSEDHHPAILTEYGRVTVTWWTHAINGLSRNDFIMAAKTDASHR